MIIRYVKFEGDLWLILFHCLENLLRHGDLVWIFWLMSSACSHDVILGESCEWPLSVVNFLVEHINAGVFFVFISEVLVDLFNVQHLSRLVSNYQELIVFLFLMIRLRVHWLFRGSCCHKAASRSHIVHYYHDISVRLHHGHSRMAISRIGKGYPWWKLFNLTQSVMEFARPISESGKWSGDLLF